MKIKKLGTTNLKFPKAFAIGKKSARSDDSIAASELLDEHLGKSESKQGGGDANLADDDDVTKSDGGDTGSVAQSSVDEAPAHKQDDGDHDVDDDASASTQVRLGRSISYVLGEEERKQAKRAARASATRTCSRDELESSGRPPLPRAQHRHSSSRAGSSTSSSEDNLKREGATGTGSGTASDSDDDTELSRDRSIRSRDKNMGSIEVHATGSVDNSVYDQEKKADHGSKMVFEFDENGIQGVDLTKLSSSHDSDDSDRCPTVIMDDQTIEIVNSMSDSSVSNDHHQAKKKSTATKGKSAKVGADTLQPPQYEITGADRIVIRVSNTKKSIKFYSKLGFERIERPIHLKEKQEAEALDANDTWLSNGKVVIYLIEGEAEDDDCDNTITQTMGNISLYASKAEEAIALLQKTSMPFVANVRVVGSGNDKRSLRRAFIRDPDGNYIEISNLKASNAAVKVSSEDYGADQSKSVVVGNIMRRLMSEADLRPSFNEGEIDIEFDEDVIEKATVLIKSLSDSHMTTVPTNILNFINNHSREKSQQRLKSSRSISYLETAQIEKNNVAGIDELMSSNSKSEDEGSLRNLIESVNHLSLTVSDVKKSIKFYTDVLGLEEVKLPMASKMKNIGSVVAGDVVINLLEGDPKAHNPLEGQVFLNALGMSTALKTFQEKKIPYRIHFAGDPAKSEVDASLIEVYISDPDGYPIVLGNYADASQSKCITDGTSNSHIKAIPRQYQPTAVDSKVLRNFARRRKFEGDICYLFGRNDLKKILLEAGNDAPTALQIMKQKRETEAKKKAEKELKLKGEREAGEASKTSAGFMCCGGCCY